MQNRVVITAMAVLATFMEVAVMMGILCSRGNEAFMSSTTASVQAPPAVRI
jgi:hypothetical protein